MTSYIIPGWCTRNSVSKLQSVAGPAFAHHDRLVGREIQDIDGERRRRIRIDQGREHVVLEYAPRLFSTSIRIPFDLGDIEFEEPEAHFSGSSCPVRIEPNADGSRAAVHVGFRNGGKVCNESTFAMPTSHTNQFTGQWDVLCADQLRRAIRIEHFRRGNIHIVHRAAEAAYRNGRIRGESSTTLIGKIRV